MNVLLSSGSAERLGGMKKVSPEYRKSRRNTESLAGMHQPPVDLLCLQGASTAGMRQPPGGGK